MPPRRTPASTLTGPAASVAARRLGQHTRSEEEGAHQAKLLRQQLKAAAAEGRSLKWQLKEERSKRRAAEAALQEAQAAATARHAGGRVALHHAAKRGDVATLRVALAVDPGCAALRDNSGDTPFHLAAGCGSVQAMQLLRAQPQIP